MICTILPAIVFDGINFNIEAMESENGLLKNCMFCHPIQENEMPRTVHAFYTLLRFVAIWKWSFILVSFRVSSMARVQARVMWIQ